MTYLQAHQLNTVLNACSAPVTITHDGKPVDVRPKLSGNARLEIAKAMVALQPVLEASSKATKAIVEQHGGPWASMADAQPDAYAKANAEVLAFQATDSGLKITLAISESELAADDANLSPDIIAWLLPYLS